MSGLWGNGPVGKELPRPKWTVVLLWTLGLLSWLLVIASLVYYGLRPETQVAAWPQQTMVLLSGLVLGAISIGLALMLKYLFSVSVSARLMERMLRDNLEKKEGDDAAVPEMGGAAAAEVVSLLAEIMENTLLDDSEKAEKRQLAKKHRQQTLRREIVAQIRTGKFREARERLEEFTLRYGQTQEVADLAAQLSEALRQHEMTEIANVTEQVQRYMGLGLWERAWRPASAWPSSSPRTRMRPACPRPSAWNRPPAPARNSSGCIARSSTWWPASTGARPSTPPRRSSSSIPTAPRPAACATRWRNSAATPPSPNARSGRTASPSTSRPAATWRPTTWPWNS